MREQSPRVRSWTAQGPSEADARTQTAPLRPRDQHRPRVPPKPPARPLRTRCRYRPETTAPGSVPPTRSPHLITAHAGLPRPHRVNATAPIRLLAPPLRDDVADV